MLTLLLALACTGPSPDPDPVPPGPDIAPETPATPETPTNPETPATPEAGEPYVRPLADYDMEKYVDGFTFWGWSADGSRYAYETHRGNQGAIECDAGAELTVVDATTDRYAEGGQLEVKATTEVFVEGEACTIEDVLKLLDAQREAHLAKFGIVEGLATTAIPLTEGDGGWRFSTPDGANYTLTLEVSGPGWDDPSVGAGFTGTLSKQGGGSVVFEDGSTKRPFHFDYTPDLVFLSPSGQRAALVTTKVRMAFEAKRHQPMTSAVDLSAL